MTNNTNELNFEVKIKPIWQTPSLKSINIKKTLATSGLATDSATPAGSK